MTASLPMYETAPMRGALDRFWERIRCHYGDGPEALDRTSDPHALWNDPDLLLSQTCGLPYRTTLLNKVRLIGTPDYGVAGCPPGYYRSVLAVRANDPRSSLSAFDGARLARNDIRSQSGWGAVATYMSQEAPRIRFSESIVETGSHLSSLRAIREGEADIAGVDAVTWALLARDTTETAGLKVIASTAPSPGLPYITGLGQNVDALRHALATALASLSDEDRTCLMIRGIVHIPSAVYCAVGTPKSRPANDPIGNLT